VGLLDFWIEVAEGRLSRTKAGDFEVGLECRLGDGAGRSCITYPGKDRGRSGSWYSVHVLYMYHAHWDSVTVPTRYLMCRQVLRLIAGDGRPGQPSGYLHEAYT
jgi:hypothetical protein